MFPNVPKATGLKITRYTPMRSRPDEILEGDVLWNGKSYQFGYNHDFDSGNTYIIMENGDPVAYFFIFLGDAADDRASEQPDFAADAETMLCNPEPGRSPE